LLKSTAVLVMDEVASRFCISSTRTWLCPLLHHQADDALVVLEAGQSMDEVLQITAADRDTERGTHRDWPSVPA
jgi:hypothetical protein